VRAPVRRRDLVLLVALTVTLRLVAAWAIPLGFGPSFNCAPDEAGHFWAARELALGHDATWPQSLSIYSAYLPAPYLAHAAALALLGRLDRPWLYRMPLEAERVRGYPLARLGSILLGAVTVVALALAAAAWTASRAAGIVAGAVTALYPQLVFVDAYTNGDAYTIAAGALLALALTRWARAGEADPGLGAVAAATGAVLLGKPNGYALVVPTLCWIGWAAACCRVRGATLGRGLAIVVAVAGPMLAWNAVRNDGDVLGLARYRQLLAGPYQPTAVATVPDPIATFTRLLATSAFGRFANMSLPLATPLLVTALVLLVIGLGTALTGLRSADGVTVRGTLWLAGSTALSLALVALNSWRVDFQPQGRYLLLCAVLLTIVAVWAPSRLRPRLRRAWPILYLAFLALAALETEILLYRYPCG
jgi:4-amino-4-deoxy-L-arabinose transferase-like glycosyltransferase